MAITIGVCDDNPEQVGVLIQYIRSHHGADWLDVIESTNPETFMVLLQDKKPQIVFLDIDMGGINGISVGERIKTLYKDVVLVYVTAHEKYALEAFDVRAFHYLLKPLTRKRFDEVLEEALKHIEKAPVKSDKTLMIKIKKEVVCLNYGDVVYFENWAIK